MNVFKSTRTLVCAAGILLTSLLTACGGGSDQGRDPILGLPAADVVSVAVTPATATVLIGVTQQYTATANYSDGSSHVVTTGAAWTSGSPLIGSVGGATGLATGLAAGSTQINASFGGKAGSANLTVTAPPTLASIAVTPATPSIFVGSTQQFVATGTYSDGSVAVLPAPVWSSNTPAVATISPTGLATGLIPGNTIISATSGVRIGNAVLNVNAVVVLPPVPPLPPLPPVPPVPPVPPLADTVPLGGAERFAVLAGTSITNPAGGLTLVTGDVGSPSQSSDPAQTAGWANYKSGAILQLGLDDLQVAITNANARPCTVSSAADIDLGGQILPPGVYCYTGNVNITGTLILNGPGLYIFRTAGTLDAVANAVVAVAGGASANEIFWVPTGATTLGANGAFLGTIMAQSAAITVGDMTTLLTGRVLSAAAVTLRNNVISK